MINCYPPGTTCGMETKGFSMTHVYRHPKYWAELRKLQRIEKNKQAQTNEQQASNQQASKDSSTVDQEPGTTDSQA